VESYPYPVKEGQRYINLNPGRVFVQQPPKREKDPEAHLNYVTYPPAPVADSEWVCVLNEYALFTVQVETYRQRTEKKHRKNT